MSWLDKKINSWMEDWDNDGAELPSDAVRNAISKAVLQTIARCAEVANSGRMYAEGDIRSVVSAIRSLTDTNDPWDEEDRK